MVNVTKNKRSGNLTHALNDFSNKIGYGSVDGIGDSALQVRGMLHSVRQILRGAGQLVRSVGESIEDLGDAVSAATGG